MARPVQQSVGWTECLVAKLPRDDELLFDLSFDTFATTMACFELPRCLRFLGCNIDAEIFAGSTDALVET